MFALSRKSAIAAIVALTGCTAALFVPQDAFAGHFAGHRVQAQRTRATFVRPRPVQHVQRMAAPVHRSFQPHQAAVLNRSTSFSRPAVHTASMVHPTALPRTNTMSLSRPFGTGGLSRATSTNTTAPRFAASGTVSNAPQRFASVSANTQTSGPRPPAFAAQSVQASSRPRTFTETRGFVTSDTGFTDASKRTPVPVTDNRPVFVPPPKAIQAAQLGVAAKNAPVFVPPPKAIQAAQLGAAQNQTAGTSGLATHPQPKCIVAPCPTHTPVGKTQNPSGTAQQDPPRHPGNNRGPSFGLGPISLQGSAPSQSASDSTSNSGGSSSGDSVAQAPADSGTTQTTAPADTQVAALQNTYLTPIATARSAATVQRATAAAAAPAPRFVLVAFNQNITAADLAIFLQAYNVSVTGAPTADGVYKLRIADDYPSDQLPQLVDSMKSQTAFVTDAAAS